MLIKVKGHRIFDEPNKNKFFYLNALQIAIIEEIDDKTCEVIMATGDDYIVVEANFDMIAMMAKRELKS